MCKHRVLTTKQALYLGVITLPDVKYWAKLTEKAVLQVLGREAEQPQVGTQQVKLQAPKHQWSRANHLTLAMLLSNTKYANNISSDQQRTSVV